MSQRAFCGLIIGLFALAGCGSSRQLVVASKHFNESYLLAEIMSQLLEDRGISVDRRYGLGGTMICFQALDRARRQATG